MSGDPAPILGLVRELRRRKVVTSGLIYVGAALLVLFVAGQGRREEVVPRGVVAGLELLAGLGLPITLALVWRAGGTESKHRPAASAGPDRATRRAARWALALVALTSIAAAVVAARGQLASPAPTEAVLEPADTLAAGVRWAPDPLRVAVLYLDNRTGADSLRYLASGLTEDLIDALHRWEPVTTVPRSAARAAEDGRVSVDSLTRELGVRLYVAGSVERVGSRRRVALRLVDAATGDTVSVREVSRPAGDPLQLRDAVVQELESALEQLLGVGIRASAGPGGEPVTGRAWALVHRADAVVERVQQQGPVVPEADPEARRRALDRADSLLARAETAAPQWVVPILRRGWLEYRRARSHGPEPGVLAATPLLRGLGHAERALVLRPGDRPAALDLRGQLRRALASTMDPGGGRNRMLRLARLDLTEAVELRPGLARAWQGLEEVLRAEGASEAAERAGLRALMEDPYLDEGPRLYGRLFHASLEAGEDATAARWCETGRRRYPRDPELALCGLLLQISVDSLQPNAEAARAVVDSALALAAPADTARLRRFAALQLAKVFARTGRPDSARAYIQRARGDAFRPALAYEEAHARLLLGQPDSALVLLRAVLRADPERVRSWPRDPWLRDLWNDPRFLQLIETAGD